jgi:hypothetical protein
MFTSIITDMRKFMEGEKNHLDQDLLAILKGEAFFGHDQNLRTHIQTQADQVFKAFVVNAL